MGIQILAVGMMPSLTTPTKVARLELFPTDISSSRHRNLSFKEGIEESLLFLLGLPFSDYSLARILHIPLLLSGI